MAIYRVPGQGAGSAPGVATPITQAYANNVTSGNLAIVVVGRATAAQSDVLVGDLTKSAGTATIGTIALDAQISANFGGAWEAIGIFSIPITGSGSLTFSFVVGVGGAGIIAIQELTEADVSGTRLIGTSATTGTSATPATGTVASGQAAYYVGGVGQLTAGAVTFTPGTKYQTIFEKETYDPSYTGSAEDRIINSDQTIAANWTTSSAAGVWVAVVAAYKQVAGPAATTVIGGGGYIGSPAAW